MKTLTALLYTDLKAARFWLSKNTISKLLVIAGFSVIFTLVGAAIYLVTSAMMVTFEGTLVFGSLTAFYLIHAAILFLAWFALVTTTLTTLNLYLKNNPVQTFLFCLPVSPQTIFWWKFGKLLSTQFLLMGLFLLPVVLAYHRVFGVSGWLLPGLKILTATAVLVIVTLVGGVLFAYLLITLTRLRLRQAFGISGLIFFASGTAVLNLIHPRNMKMFYFLQTEEEFISFFHSLPLGRPGWPTYWLTESFTGGNPVRSAILLAGAVVIGVVVVHTLGSSFRQFNQRLQEVRLWRETKPFRKLKTSFDREKLLLHPWPIFFKDWLSISRYPGEMGYGGMIMVLAGVFLSLSITVSRKSMDITRMENEIMLYFFGSLVFFTVAFLLRFVFPLIAREGANPWYIFSLPISPVRLLREKLLLGVALSSIFVILAALVWVAIIPVSGSLWIPLGVSLVTILFLAAVVSVMGAISPNFSEAHDPEKISTSGSGLWALAVSSFLVVGNGWTFFNFLEGNIGRTAMFTVVLFFDCLLLAGIYLVWRGGRRYEF